MSAYVKGFAQFSGSAGWISISGNLQLLRIEFFLTSWSRFVFQAEFIFSFTTLFP
ncbi:unnamed protein product [Hymenolepis diminuta]|uniref:Uncharacterized protein n=1 Tax=Hymenolepis diminuta TaxID=6216 RepID=A0A564XXX4_HYMDI|nr:unnamed protein product [Hymenolepis diminuta]